MQDYVSAVLFVHAIETEHLVERLRDHPSHASIKPVLFDALMADPERVLTGVEHVVVSGPMDAIKAIVLLAAERGFSVGAIPTDKQRRLARFYDIPNDLDATIDLALSAEPMTMDLVLCNGHVALFQATVGQMPLLDAPADSGRLSMLKAALPRIFKIDLIKYRFACQGGEEIITAASGCMILHHHKGSIAGRLIAKDTIIADGSVSTLISAPMSVVKYLKFLFQLMSRTSGGGKLPSSIGYLKSPVIEIEPETRLDVWIDGEKQTHTPLRCEVKASSIRINAGQAIRAEASTGDLGVQRVETDHLPRGKELKKAWKRERIPFFSYASEERFHDLFTALRDDSKINGLYLVLMVLSTMLAAAGLYLDSASVIIGAMLLAPLMAPIVSLAMGLLRGEETMIRSSLIKILAGIAGKRRGETIADPLG
jgi:diacylglycerol kinase family enzyme